MTESRNEAKTALLGLLIFCSVLALVIWIGFFTPYMGKHVSDDGVMVYVTYNGGWVYCERVTKITPDNVCKARENAREYKKEWRSKHKEAYWENYRQENGRYKSGSTRKAYRKAKRSCRK